jgi:hypothetical protein
MKDMQAVQDQLEDQVRSEAAQKADLQVGAGVVGLRRTCWTDTPSPPECLQRARC